MAPLIPEELSKAFEDAEDRVDAALREFDRLEAIRANVYGVGDQIEIFQRSELEDLERQRRNAAKELEEARDAMIKAARDVNDAWKGIDQIEAVRYAMDAIQQRKEIRAASAPRIDPLRPAVGRVVSGRETTLGARVRARRIALGMTLTALSESCGTSKGHLSDIENEKHENLTIGTAREIAAALDLRLSDLIDD